MFLKIVNTLGLTGSKAMQHKYLTHTGQGGAVTSIAHVWPGRALAGSANSQNPVNDPYVMSACVSHTRRWATTCYIESPK